MDKGEKAHYENDFEIQMLENTADYYKTKAANWIEVDSCPVYMLKASLSIFCLGNSDCCIFLIDICNNLYPFEYTG